LALDLGPANSEPAERVATLRRLNLIAVVAVLDALLLAVLLWASFGDRESVVHILGPIHGIGFVLLLVLCLRGTVEERWDWWFPALVVVTGGPLGSLLGDYVLRRRLGPDGPTH
jgi:integral membrane protein